LTSQTSGPKSMCKPSTYSSGELNPACAAKHAIQHSTNRMNKAASSSKRLKETSSATRLTNLYLLFRSQLTCYSPISLNGTQSNIPISAPHTINTPRHLLFGVSHLIKTPPIGKQRSPSLHGLSMRTTISAPLPPADFK
jgi:hypothetical protein